MNVDEEAARVIEIGDAFRSTTSRLDETVRAHNSVAKAIGVHETRLNDLQSRVELTEAHADLPRGGIGAPSGFKRVETANGPAFVVDSQVRLADVPALRSKKAPEISLERWLAAVAVGERCGDREAVAYAREQKQLTSATSGVLLPVEYQAQWIDLLRARMVLNTAGCRTVPMNAKSEVWAAVTADPTASWHTEAATVNAANPTFASRTLYAQTIVTRCQSSMELAADSPDFGAQLATVMTRAMAAEIDRVGLEGTGTAPMPRGIKNTTGRLTIGTIGTPTDYSKVVAGIGQLLTNNADLAQVTKFAVMAPAQWTELENLPTGLTGDKTQLRRPNSIANMQFRVTSNVTAGTIYLGDFRDLVMGARLESAVEILKLGTYATNLLIEFIGYIRVDFLAQRPASFCTLEGIT